MMDERRAVLFSEMTPERSWEREFNEWYDLHHIPIRMKVPGFVSAQRYKNPKGLNYLAIYEINSPAVLKTPAYLAVKNNPNDTTKRMLAGVTGFTRYIANETAVQKRSGNVEALDAPHVYCVFFDVPAERAGEFNEWYDTDHVPTLMGCPDWLMVRRFEVLDGEPEKWTHLALHYLADRQALESAAREKARQSP